MKGDRVIVIIEGKLFEAPLENDSRNFALRIALRHADNPAEELVGLGNERVSLNAVKAHG